jgi:hypothetical protein
LADIPPDTLKVKISPKEVVGKYSPSPADILRAKRSTDRVIAATPYSDALGLKNLYQQKQELSNMFENVSGPGAEASKKYARSALASDFRKVLPETQSGKISYVRSILAPMLFRSAFLGSPAVAGGAVAGASGLATMAENPAIRQVLMQVLQKLTQNKSAKDGE